MDSRAMVATGSWYFTNVWIFSGKRDRRITGDLEFLCGLLDGC